MAPRNRVLAVVIARGGSKRLPRKNLQPLAGVPLVAHPFLFARKCSEISRVILSTDDREIAQVAKDHGADVPFLRPPELASDEAAAWPVLQHALASVDPVGDEFDHVLLLDPTAPFRRPEDVAHALRRLGEVPEADGIVGVSKPDFNPIWHSVVDRDGWMVDLFDEAKDHVRSQDVPTVYRINASLYIWRTTFVRRARDWRGGHLLLHEIPDIRGLNIDTEEQFRHAEVLLAAGLVKPSWE